MYKIDALKDLKKLLEFKFNNQKQFKDKKEIEHLKQLLKEVNYEINQYPEGLRK